MLRACHVGNLTPWGMAILLLTVLSVICNAEKLSNGEDVLRFVESNIQKHDIMVFAKTYCPYCKATKSTFKELLSELGFKDDDLSFKVIELDELPGNDGPLIQGELYTVTGQRTVPNVFIRGMHIGGNSDVQELLRENQLAQMIHTYN